jgi:hypothetical protein
MIYHRNWWCHNNLTTKVWLHACMKSSRFYVFILCIKICTGQKNYLLLIKCSSPLSICTQFLQFSCLKYRVWWNGFLVYVKVEFYRLHQAEKSSSNLEKNPVHHFDISNWRIAKNQVQIDMCLTFSWCTKYLLTL